MSEILHKTATEITALATVVTRKRFLELSEKIPVDLLSQEAGDKLLTHLRLLAREYHATVNDIIATIEESQTIDMVNPRPLAEAVARRIMDRRSHELG